MSSKDEKLAWLKALGVMGGKATGVSVVGDPDGDKPGIAGFSERVVAGPKTDIGWADTNPAPATGKETPMGDSGPRVAPPKPPPAPANQRPIVNVEPPDPAVLDAQDKAAAGYELPPFRRSPGDGKVVPVKDALKAMQKNSDLVSISGDELHRTAWRDWLGQKGEPPPAFRAGGRIRINPSLLPPDAVHTIIGVQAAKLNQELKDLRDELKGLRDQLATALPDKERPKVEARLKLAARKVGGIQSELKILAERLEAMPEMEGFRGKDPGETFRAAREKFLKRTGALKKLAGALGLLLGAFAIFMELKGILEAETAQEAMDRVAGVARGVRDQAATSAVFAKFFPKGPPGISLVAGLCGDSSSSPNCQPDPEKVLEARKIAKNDMLNEAVGSYMKEMHPELFVKGPNGTYPSGAKLWEETRQQFEEAFERHQKEQVARRAEELAGRMRTLQIENGFYEYPVNPYAPVDEDADPYDQERATAIGSAIEKARQEGYKEGKARRDVIWKRANDLGLKDGKKGTPAGMEEIPKWPELQTSSEMTDRQVLARTKLLNQLLGVYRTAFDAVGAPKNASGGAAGNLTAGEMAARDQKAAALKRAKEYGLQDGKKGKPLRGEEIQTWKEVLNLEGSDRTALLHELLETYNKAFNSVAPAKAVAVGEGKTTAREMVTRDRKAAALKRASGLGTTDGKLGQKLSPEKIQTWPEVTELEGADRGALLHQLLEAYNKAFDAAPKKAGPTAAQMLDRDKKDAALKRAREMGTRDGKAGKRVNIEDIQEWEVVTELEGPARGAFLHELLETYNKAFDAVPVRLTASEMIERDHKAAAVQRAREWGSKDGKAGKISDLKAIQTWREVAALEPLARGPFIAELIRVYNKAQAEAAAAKKK